MGSLVTADFKANTNDSQKLDGSFIQKHSNRLSLLRRTLLHVVKDHRHPHLSRETRSATPIDMFLCACKHVCMGEANHSTATGPVSLAAAQEVARLMGALSTASRVRILARLRAGPCSVGELSTEVDMEQPAVSHQLRVLRDLGLVFGNRSGRHIVYGLFDSHVAALLDEALSHIDHVSANGVGHGRPSFNAHTPREKEASR